MTVIVRTHSKPEIGEAVFAAQDFQEGDLLIRSQRVETLGARNKYSVERDGKHIMMNKPAILVNHSCEPNSILVKNAHDSFDFIATRSIQKDEEITFDYETTESEISAFSSCLCQAENCRGQMNMDQSQ